MGSKVPDLRSLFLRGYGEQAHTLNNGANIGETETVHTSETLGTVQGDAFREMGAKGELTFCIIGSSETYVPLITGTGDFSVKTKYGNVSFINHMTGGSPKIVSLDMSNSLPIHQTKSDQ